jgi:two-component system cell cycle response regulator DivK
MPKVLYIEDEPALAELVRRKLHRKGYEVVLADDGSRGLELAGDGRPDLILLDINLGKFSPDGFEVNRRLKDDPATRPIPVIALTAHADWTEHRDKAAREGFVDHIIKPIDFDLLLRRIAVILHPEGGI